jgi:hypothetical protein
MGTWSYAPLDNDDATDFAANFYDSKDIFILEGAFDSVCGAKNEFLEAPSAQEAVAAAQLLKDLDDSQINPVDRNRLNQKSNAALRKILEKSELKDLRSGSPDYDRWSEAVESLLR